MLKQMATGPRSGLRLTPSSPIPPSRPRRWGAPQPQNMRKGRGPTNRWPWRRAITRGSWAGRQPAATGGGLALAATRLDGGARGRSNDDNDDNVNNDDKDDDVENDDAALGGASARTGESRKGGGADTARPIGRGTTTTTTRPWGAQVQGQENRGRLEGLIDTASPTGRGQ